MKTYSFLILGVLSILTVVIVWISDSKLSANSQNTIYDQVEVSEKAKLDAFVQKTKTVMVYKFDQMKSDEKALEAHSKIHQSLKELARIDKCWLDINCQIEFEAESPLAAAEAFRDQSMKHLDTVKDYVFRNPNEVEEFEFVFERYSKHQDDYLKEAALEYYYWVEPTLKRFETVMSALSITSSVPLMKSALPLLENYQKVGFGREVAGFVSHQIQFGGFFSARYLAQDSLRFMSPETIDIFYQTIDRLPVELKRRRYLQMAISEYIRSQNLSGSSDL